MVVLSTKVLKWHVISLGISDPVSLDAETIQILEKATLIIGSQRQLDLVNNWTNESQELLTLPSPFSDLEALLKDKVGHLNNTSPPDEIFWVFLASGDALHFGIGQWVLTFAKKIGLPKHNIFFSPGLSSIQVACHRIGLPWQNVITISLHGRPIEKLRTHVRSNSWHAILTDHNNTPIKVAQMLLAARWSNAKLWVLEALGMPEEKVREFTVTELSYCECVFHSLNVILLKTDSDKYHREHSDYEKYPSFPGIPDNAFVTDLTGSHNPGKGLITKKEVRVTALMHLSPQPQEIGWDLGAGCGGLSIEWARWAPTLKLHCVEKNLERSQCLIINAKEYGVMDQLICHQRNILDLIHTLPRPNKIFIGGSGGQLFEMLNDSWDKLLAGGRLVISAITEKSIFDAQKFHNMLSEREGPAALYSYHDRVRVQISRYEMVGNEPILKPQIPVTLFVWEKTLKEGEL